MATDALWAQEKTCVASEVSVADIPGLKAHLSQTTQPPLYMSAASQFPAPAGQNTSYGVWIQRGVEQRELVPVRSLLTFLMRVNAVM